MPQEVGRVTATQQASDLLRSQRVAALQRQLQVGDFDAARYESTPRRRAEVLAAVLSKVLSRGQMRQRLRKLGVSTQFERGTLLAISVEGGGIDVRGANGQGQVVTGPGVDERLLDVFPELVPFTLRNLTLTVTPGVSYDDGDDVWNPGDPDPDNMGGSGVEAWALTFFLSSYTATAAVVQPQIGRSSFHPFGGDRITSATVTSEYWTASIGDFLTLQPWNGGALYKPGQTFFSGPYGVAWPADGLNWIQTHAEQADAVVGATSWTAVYDASANTQAHLGFLFNSLTITYTATGCDTCDLDLQVNDFCTGVPILGGTFDLGNGTSCITDSSGVCTITGIPHGDYTWTFTATGYEPLSGDYACACEGGSSTLILTPVPEGGCGGPCDVDVTVTSTCDGEPVEGVSILVDEVEFCVTGVDGQCSIEGIALGEHTLSAEHEDWQTEEQGFLCEGSGTAPIEFTLTPNGGCPPAACRDTLAAGPMRRSALFVREGDCERMFVGPMRYAGLYVRGPHS